MSSPRLTRLSDLPPGVARLKFDGGHGGQNGLRDTIRLLGFLKSQAPGAKITLVANRLPT